MHSSQPHQHLRTFSIRGPKIETDMRQRHTILNRFVNPSSLSDLMGLKDPRFRAADTLGSLVRCMSRATMLAVIFLPAIATAASARGNTAAPKTQWQQAIEDSFAIQHTTTGDLNADGIAETIACYREDKSSGGRDSGIVIFQDGSAKDSPDFHVIMKGAACKKLKVKGNKLGMLTVRGATQEKVVWTYGKEIIFTNEPSHPLHPDVIEMSAADDASRPGSLTPLIDGNIDTSWAERSSGTGIGQTITVRFAFPMEVGYLAIYPGHGGGKRDFYAHNRVHRLSVTAQTQADLGDSDAELDFSDFGIDIGGDRTESVLPDTPKVTYVYIGKKDVKQLELRIDSVYLGKLKDETHIAEIEIVPTIHRKAMLPEAKPLANKATPRKKVEKEEDEAIESSKSAVGQKRRQDLLESLDSTGRSVISGDDF